MQTSGPSFSPLQGAWWLVRKGRYDEAKATLVRTAKEGYYDDKNLDGYIATMKHTDLVDKVESSQGSYKECFTGTNLRRTEIVGHTSIGLNLNTYTNGSLMTCSFARSLDAGRCKCGEDRQSLDS